MAERSSAGEATAVRRSLRVEGPPSHALPGSANFRKQTPRLGERRNRERIHTKVRSCNLITSLAGIMVLKAELKSVKTRLM